MPRILTDAKVGVTANPEMKVVGLLVRIEGQEDTILALDPQVLYNIAKEAMEVSKQMGASSLELVQQKLIVP